MPNILIAEGTPALWQTEHAGFAIPSNFSLFATAVQLHDPGIRCTLINIADGGTWPLGTALSDFDSSKHQIWRVLRRHEISLALAVPSSRSIRASTVVSA